MPGELVKLLIQLTAAKQRYSQSESRSSLIDEVYILQCPGNQRTQYLLQAQVQETRVPLGQMSGSSLVERPNLG